MTGWWSQAFSPEGSTTAGGILRQLGRPSLDELTVLVREAAQNSWDARNGSSEVEFSVRLLRLGDRATSWARLLTPGPPDASIERFGDSLDPSAWLIVISDRGTVGLRGPIRASVRPRDDEGNDFVQFLRNVGEPRDTDMGGGTYGFGKGILYRISSVRAILADTATRSGSAIERRLMGAALGDDYYDSHDVRFTGRHWWGQVADDGVVDPLTGDAARAAALELGLPAFADGQTGTNVVILAADLGADVVDGVGVDRDPTAAAEYIASSILWHLWPKFSSLDGGSGSMNFKVELEGEELEIPSPDSVAELAPFAAALTSIRQGTAEPHRRTRPDLYVGDLAVVIAPSTPSGLNVVEAARPFEGPPHHVARMRTTELVVDYYAGPVHPDPLFSYGGVYRTTRAADQHFADAEPPTHDSWVESGLPGVSKSIVASARTKIRANLGDRFLPASTEASVVTPGLGGVSRRLASLVARTRGSAPEPTGGGGGGTGGGGGGGHGKGARIIGEPWIGALGDSVVVFARVAVPDFGRPVVLRALVEIVLDGGGRETQGPKGAIGPAVIGWVRAAEEAVVRMGPAIEEPEQGEWLVAAELQDDVMIRIRIEEVVAHGS